MIGIYRSPFESPMVIHHCRRYGQLALVSHQLPAETYYNVPINLLQPQMVTVTKARPTDQSITTYIYI